MANLFKKLPLFFFLFTLILLISVSSSSARLLRQQSLSPALKLDIPADPAAPTMTEYESLLLGFLPKGGSIPPSGPSKGTNNFNT
ncbi:hypothetical protein Csa_005505 [Cucumis sativus]|uniref:Uncharacterized protein n=1 Tax=Cucumis sativus TaxID=3659 RepID=A0A0A0K7U2_CUCSA|nr:hypothetical protein Csa_005505 [Cucumis sativus]